MRLIQRLLDRWRQGRKPVNYESLHVSDGTIAYVAHGQRHLIPLREVVKLELVREEALFADLEGPYIESKWLLHTADGSSVEIMDEWPHRRLLLDAFAKHLSGFDREAASRGLEASGEGQWVCHQGEPID